MGILMIIAEQLIDCLLGKVVAKLRIIKWHQEHRRLGDQVTPRAGG